MPTRWFVPVVQVDPRRVRVEYIHAAFSRWFDRDLAEHTANTKPYAVSPLTAQHGPIGVEIATLTDHTEGQLRAASGPGRQVRLGNQTRDVGVPRRLFGARWEELDRPPYESRWTLHLLTPATFRSGDRASPLPTVATILSGLARSWNLWSGLPPRDLGPQQFGAVWVSDLDLRSEVVPLTIRAQSGDSHRVHVSGSLGSITLRCDDDEIRRTVAPLLRLAPYTGIGSMRAKGFGVVRLRTGTPVVATE